MTKKEIIKLIEALFKTYDYQKEFGEALEKFVDGWVNLNETPLQKEVYRLLEEKLPNFYSVFSEFYRYGYVWYADTQELLDIGYYEETKEKGTYYEYKEKLEEAKKLPSYRELGTEEEVFDYYFGDFLDE